MTKPTAPSEAPVEPVDPRRRAITAREEALGARETGIEAREEATSTRERSLSEREELTRYREDALRAREEAREATATRDAVIAQMREANESLVMATLRAETLAEEADAARRAIEQSEERFRSLVTTAAAIVWRAGPEGAVEIVDPQTWRRFTSSDPPAAGDGWLAAVHPDDRNRVRDAWAWSVETHAPYAQDHRLRKGDGSYAWVVSRAVPIPSEGPVREWIGTMTDVSDRVRVEEARDRFIGILGHDLRTPLQAITMGAKLLERAGLPERPTELATRISRSARRIEVMIDALLMFARARLGGGIPLVRRPSDLGRICFDELEETRQAYPGRAIFGSTSGDLSGDWDPDRLEQMLTNLIANAVVHGADPIRISARGDGDSVALSVHNGGAPIPAATMGTMFEPFQAQPGSKGLGLGLYIVSEIVRAHGGSISVRSAEGEGTTFTIELPRRAPGAQGAP